MESPDIGIIKLNFDTSFQSDSRTSNATVLARNSEDEIIRACTYLFEDVVDGFVAKVRACERAMIFASKMGFWCLLLEGDSLSDLACHWIALLMRNQREN